MGVKIVFPEIFTCTRIYPKCWIRYALKYLSSTSTAPVFVPMYRMFIVQFSLKSCEMIDKMTEPQPNIGISIQKYYLQKCGQSSVGYGMPMHLRQSLLFNCPSLLFFVIYFTNHHHYQPAGVLLIFSFSILI